MLSRCMLANVNKDQKLCEDPVQDYAVCLKNVTQKFYLSTVLSFCFFIFFWGFWHVLLDDLNLGLDWGERPAYLKELSFLRVA